MDVVVNTGLRLDYRLWASTCASRAISTVAELLLHTDHVAIAFFDLSVCGSRAVGLA